MNHTLYRGTEVLFEYLYIRHTIQSLELGFDSKSGKNANDSTIQKYDKYYTVKSFE